MTFTMIMIFTLGFFLDRHTLIFFYFFCKCYQFLELFFFKAEQLIDEFNFELAQKFCQRALETDPDNMRALQTSATLLLELGQTESAKHVRFILYKLFS